MKNKKSKLIVVLGPTASGKTDLAIKLAKKFDGEIVNADSRAIYREMKVATDRPILKEGGIRHHLVNFVAPDKDFSLSDYKLLAIEKINDIIRRGKTPFLVGGTWLYISAVVDNLDFPKVEPNKNFRKKLEKVSSNVLYKRLEKKDKEASSKIHPNDKRRIIRALEVIHFSGKKISEQQKKGEKLFDVLKIGVKRDLAEIEKRARLRIKKDMGEKLIRETKKLLKKYNSKLSSMSSIGYREIGEYLYGLVSKEQAYENLALNTRRLARYQLNTFSKDKKIKWIKDLADANNKVKMFLKK